MKKAFVWLAILGFAALPALGDDAEDSYQSGLALQNKGDLDGALTAFSRAIALKPGYAEAYNGRGLMRQFKGDASGASFDFNKAVELKPDYAEAYFDRGRLKQGGGDLQSALADFNKSIELNPSFVAYFARGRTKQMEDDLAGALADFNKTIELNPSFAGVYYFRGCLFYDQHSFNKASDDFQKVCALNSPSDYAHFRLWLIRARSGQKKDATKELQTYLNVRQPGPPNGWVGKVSDFLTGRLSEPDFFKAAQEGDQEKGNASKREAFFFAGTMRLISGDEATARDYFGKCVATKAMEDPSYQSAAAELKLLPTTK